MNKRFLSALLTGAIVLTSMGLPAFAADSSGTIMGDPETIYVSSNASSKRETNFNEDWKFYLGDNNSAYGTNFNDSSWETVTLPHDFSISQSFTTYGEAESGFLPGGTGWYRKKFTLPAADSGKTVLINFDGVYSDAYVYVNGTQVGENHYGYSNFAFDITDYIIADGKTQNVIAVKAVNSIPSSRWYSGSGIYRDVTLIVTDPVHVDWNGVQVTTPDISSGKGTVNVSTTIKNDSNSAVTASVTHKVYEKKGSVVKAESAYNVSIPAGSSQTTSNNSAVVSNPKKWDIDSPNLYTLVTTLSVNGEVVDEYSTDFGFRYFSFDSNGFHLNGNNVKLNGFCLHHDQGALGSAAYYDAMYRQLSIMKDMGVNAIRTSHNPADEDFIDLCNELGLLVIEEMFDGWNVAKNGNSYDFARHFISYAETVVKNVVKRDRNAPCVIAWSLGNEIQEGASTNWQFPTIANNLINWVNSVDDTRPTTIGDNTRGGNITLTSVINNITNNGGIAGFNYANSASTLYSLARIYGGTFGCIIASETSSATNSRGIYSSQNNNSNADGKYHLTSYDTSAVSWGITAHDSIYNTYQYDCVAGEFVWTGFDYIGEPTPWNGTAIGSIPGSGATPNSSYFGIVETTGFEKDTYYLYRSQWNKSKNTLHLVTAWDGDNMYTTGGKTPVVIYSNAAKVELYRNGTLIGTATRKANTSSAGHTYYTYSVSSNNPSVCTAVSASGSSALYATFNVTFESGTISAKAYDASGKEITSTCAGNNSVSTPGTVSKLAVSANEKVILADGSSLVYVTVDVTDEGGNLKTTAANTINFSLTGNGEIVGVDNGDQATTAKYQQSSVLTSTTSAKIAAYAGKALVIVRSTKDAGSFTVTASASGLTGGSATVTTTAVPAEPVAEGLVSYTMVRDYTVKAGTAPTLQTTATGTLSTGETISGTIEWGAVSSDTYNNAGDYTINGVLTINGNKIDVTCRLHVIANIIALRNVATATTPGTTPTLPSTVRGLLADGTLSGEFAVAWDEMTPSQFATVGDIVTVNGTAAIFGNETLPVTASIRVAQAVNEDSSNITGQASSITEDCTYTSDNLASIKDGKTSTGTTSERWTNYNNQWTSDTATITLNWDTAHSIESVNLYFFTDNYSAALPNTVKFAYSLDSQNYTEIGYESVTPTAGFTKTAYKFNEVINPVSLRIILTQQSGHCVGLTEVEVMTYAGKLTYNTSADLSSISVDGKAIGGFSASNLTYTATGSTVTAESDDNMGITILPINDNIVRVITLAEDGSVTKTYSITLEGAQEACKHENIEVRGAVAATCTTTGYTGDKVCTICNETIEYGTVIPMTEHSWDDGVVTVKPTTTTEGEKTFTCTVCKETKVEKIDKLPTEKKVPSVTLSIEKNVNKIKMIGQFEDYDNLAEYYTVTSHGIVYIQQNRLGTRNLTVSYPGRTRVNFGAYSATGSFSYSLKPANANTRYTVRAFLAYTDANGRTIYVYSAPQTVKLADLG